MKTKVKLVSKMKDYPYIEIGDIGHIEGHINGADNCPYIICVFGKHIVYASFYNIEVVELEEVKEEQTITQYSCIHGMHFNGNGASTKCLHGCNDRKEEKEWQQEEFITLEQEPKSKEDYLCVSFPVSEIGDNNAINKAADYIKKVLINKEWEK